MLLRQIIEQYENHAKIARKEKSASGYAVALRQFCLYMHNPHIENIHANEVNLYFNEMYELGWKPNGIMPKSIALRNLWEYAEQLGLKVFSHTLIAIPRREYRIPRVATDEEVAKMLDLCPKGHRNMQHARNRAIITFLRSTGCRNSELVALNYSQLMEHFEEKRVVIRTAKSRGIRPIREIFWDDETHEDLKAWLEVRRNLNKEIVFKEKDALFVGLRGWQTGKRVTNGAIGIFLRKLSRDAEIPTLNAHSLRHRRGHELNELGANNSTISGVLGHASLASSFIYTQMNSKELKTAAQKFRR